MKSPNRLREARIASLDPPLPSIRSDRAARVAEMFGISCRLADVKQPQSQTHPAVDLCALLPCPGQIVLISGASGAGKSSLLRDLRRTALGSARWIDLMRLDMPNVPIVDCFKTLSLQRSLALLSRVGLAEAWTYLRLPGELSEGQRWRLKLAKALALATAPTKTGRRSIVVCDEFAAVLDRITALIVARCLRKMIDASGDSPAAPSAIVASGHDDLIDALAPDMVISCDFSRIEISRPGSASIGGS